MSDPWTYSGKVTVLDQASGVVTLVDESTFAISGLAGDIVVGSAQGLFVRDTRILSRMELRVNGARPEALAAVSDDPFSATFVSRCRPRPGLADSTLMVFRARYVGQGMREDLVIRNFGDEPTFCSVELFVDSDFADLFAVKEGRVGRSRRRDHPRDSTPPASRSSYRRGTVSRGMALEFSPTPVVGGRRHGQLRGHRARPRRVARRASRSTPSSRARPSTPATCAGSPSTGPPRPSAWPGGAARCPRWRPTTRASAHVLARSAEDLGALRIFDPDFPERVVVAAGAPWFMTVFGRDSLITSWMALLVDPDLALGVLQTLARFQGKDIDPRSDEQPGRILHEMRFGEAPSLSLGGGSIYYGTADATPLFVMLLGELRRWGLAREAVEELLPNAERALEWIENFGDIDGDGYVEYQRATDRGLANQGWKDSWDGIRYADGTVATAPIALCEVQAYVYSAYLARAHFAQRGRRRGHLRPLPGQGHPAEDGLQPRLLAGGAGLVRRRPRRRQAPDRLAHLQHRPLPVDRHRRRGQGAHRRRQAAVARDVQRLGRPHPGHLDGRLQPDQLPLRVGVAPRHGHRGRRPVALRVHATMPNV